jgi:ADP-heptose:LPS heptosyltransferase
VFRYDAVGDYIVTTPLLQWLRQALPHVRVDVLCSHNNAPMAALDPVVEDFAAVYPVYFTRVAHPSWITAAHRLRRHRYDAVFALVFSQMSKAALLFRFIAPEAEGIAPLHWERQWLYGKVFHRQPEYRRWRLHAAEAILSMGIKSVRSSVTVREQFGFFVPLHPAAYERVTGFLQARGLGWRLPERIPPQRSAGLAIQEVSGEPYIVVNLSARTGERNWLLHHSLLVCRELLSKFPQLHLVIIALPREQKYANKLQELLGARAHCFRGNLLEIIALIAGAEWILTPDTGTVHIASAVGKPVVGLYGELIKVAEWFPLDTPFALVLSPAMESITFAPPGAVVEAAEWLLSEVVPRGARIPPVLPTTEAVGAGASEVR